MKKCILMSKAKQAALKAKGVKLVPCSKNRYDNGSALEMLVEELIDTLKRKGFNVLYYKSKTSNSHYIKLDFGAGKTIRVSDHKGKGKYRYTYNLMLNEKGERKERDKGVTRTYYGADCVDDLVCDLMVDRRCNRMKGNYDDQIRVGRHERRVAQEEDKEHSFMREAIEL